MIQIGTILKVVDNTGAKTASCLKIKSGYRRRYAYMGDIILVSIKSVRIKRRESLKVKKGEIYEALILRIRKNKILFSGDSSFFFKSSSVILINKKNKIFGTRIFGSISKYFRTTKYVKTLSLASGICSC
jgi:large subunit ribosomal protein L14